ncbi:MULTISPECIES: VPA1262 family N-terminal domain-containing protein [unclassified Janthinobacterium]|uniref:VPA1262 family N-terminal domain-containing protein n=1 Tax=unclassified Janthinobacterium TaxID=2610881 RepID=UPI00160D69AE|nr:MULTISPECIES: VPA1262 family N-terminal domain-containing protein [unclassified Janthinobacterium]MBB5607228.1 hypothetical protein [Janthinobacterium sp. S3T4]MBB5612953.1 hypothetical protein [Janthinobacterium sp. S3M3]
MTEIKNQALAVVRLVTLQKKGSVDKLLFTTITELAHGRPAPRALTRPEHFKLKGTENRLCFHRIVIPKEVAIDWYTSLSESETCFPFPATNEQGDSSRPRIQVPRLEDPQPWPVFGLPVPEELFSHQRTPTINPAPFIGSVPARLHRRFGNPVGLNAFLDDADAHTFVARRMHINLFNYKEYLGSAVYISPDPIVRQIDHFMVPASNGQGERIVYRMVPRPGQSLDELRVTTFDKEANLLTHFETYQIPSDGILEVDKGRCMGQYGFVVSHNKLGVLAYSPPTSFLRQINLNVRVNSGNTLNIKVPTGSAPDAPITEYKAASSTEWDTTSVLGAVVDAEPSVRMAAEVRKREMQAHAKHYGQRWFPAGSREDAMHFVRELLRAARFRVMIADPYLGTLQLGQFLYAIHGEQVNTTLLTTKLAFNPPSHSHETRLALLESFKNSLDELNKHQQLQPQVAIISAAELHDRFLVVDDDVWFVGNSLSGFGEKASMIVRLPDPTQVIKQLQSLACTAPDLDRYIKLVKKAYVKSSKQ